MCYSVSRCKGLEGYLEWLWSSALRGTVSDNSCWSCSVSHKWTSNVLILWRREVSSLWLYQGWQNLQDSRLISTWAAALPRVASCFNHINTSPSSLVCTLSISSSFNLMVSTYAWKGRKERMREEEGEEGLVKGGRREGTILVLWACKRHCIIFKPASAQAEAVWITEVGAMAQDQIFLNECRSHVSYGHLFLSKRLLW